MKHCWLGSQDSFIFIVLKISLLIYSVCFLTQITDAQECNIKEICADSNVTKEICDMRGCCYSIQPDRIQTCFQKIKFSPYIKPEDENKSSRREKFGEIVPDDGIQLPKTLEESMINLGNLSKTDAIQVINKLENYLKEKTIKEDSDTDWDYALDDIFSTVVKVNPDSIFEPIVFASGTEIQLKQHWGTTENGTEKNITNAIFVEYPTLISVFMKEQKRRSKECKPTEKYMDNSPVISIGVFDEDWNKLSVPVEYTVNNINTSTPTLEEDMTADLSCTYLNEILRKWNIAGCDVSSVNDSKMTCSCNHTTKFSMLFVINVLELNISRHHLNNIQILEYVMEGLSLTCLIATFGVLWLVQRRRSIASSISSLRAGERTLVHANFVAALAFLHLTRLFSELSEQNETACKSVAVLSHYFMLASGMWMLIEGLLLYINVIIRSMKNTALGVHKYWTGWGIPAVTVLIAAIIGFLNETYMEKIPIETCQIEEDGVEITPLFSTHKTYQSYCWLSKEDGMIWAATGPLVFIFAVNVFILSHTVIFVWRLNRKTDSMMPSHLSRDNKHFWKTAKSVLVLFPILGVPWLIGFLINTEESTLNLIFQYIHVVLNGLQGLFIFLLYCVVNRESRGIVNRVASSHWEQRKVSISASNTLARSTSGGSRRARGQRKSISSQMGGSDLVENTGTGGTPVYTRRPSNVRSIGSAASNYSIYTSSMNRKQSSGSGSTSMSGCAHRINRIISTGPNDTVRHKSGYYMKAGSSASLPRLGKIESHSRLRRSGSVSSINLIERNYKPNGDGSLGRHKRQSSGEQDQYICKACKDGPCIHAASDVAGLKEMQDGTNEVSLVGYKRTSSLDNLQVTDAYQQNRFPRRMTAEEFKRFSAIPEEKRRSGINSFISIDSSETNRMSVLSTFKSEDIEMKEINDKTTRVDVIAKDVHSEKLEEVENESDEGSSRVQTPIITITEPDNDSGESSSNAATPPPTLQWEIPKKAVTVLSAQFPPHPKDVFTNKEKSLDQTEFTMDIFRNNEHDMNDEEIDNIERMRREELLLTD